LAAKDKPNRHGAAISQAIIFAKSVEITTVNDHAGDRE
jgi:hypothetical protein